MLTWSVNINTIQKKNVEGVLNISKKVHPAVKEGIKYLFMSHERNTRQYHNMKVATTSSPECEKIQIFTNTKQNGKAYFVELHVMEFVYDSRPSCKNYYCRTF
jgi:microcompartment protein CcmL/EutN